MESSWYAPEKRNNDILYVNAEVRTRSGARSVKSIGKVPAKLGWTGNCFVDEHQDGSRSLHFRVRMIDGEMTSGKLRAQVDRLEFRLTSR